MEVVNEILNPWAHDFSRNMIYMLTLVTPQAMIGLISVLSMHFGIKKFRKIFGI